MEVCKWSNCLLIKERYPYFFQKKGFNALVRLWNSLNFLYCLFCLNQQVINTENYKWKKNHFLERNKCPLEITSTAPLRRVDSLHCLFTNWHLLYMEELKNGNIGILHKKIASGFFKNIKKDKNKIQSCFSNIKT